MKIFDFQSCKTFTSFHKMKRSDVLSIFSHIVNILIFMYFSILLIKINFLDVQGLSISAFGLIMSLIANIYSILERYSGR